MEDDWESPTLGAWGLGWEVWLDGMEITQFTYFQQVGGIDLKPVSLELTYGLERIAMYLQEVDNVYNLQWCKGIKYGEIHHIDEVEFSKFNFDYADTELLSKQFDAYEKESIRLNKLGLVLPSYEFCLKCSHTFNLLDARGRDFRHRTDRVYRTRKEPREALRKGFLQAARRNGISAAISRHLICLRNIFQEKRYSV